MKSYRNPDDTTAESLIRLAEILDTIPLRLRRIPEETFSHKASPDKWSPKEIIGHLIDSATNNHHRFVRGQFEDSPKISYDQDQWNIHGYYQVLDSEHVISFWEKYNRHIHEVISHIPADLLQRTCTMSDGQPYTIAWLFDDYVRHLEHHLSQVDFTIP